MTPPRRPALTRAGAVCAGVVLLASSAACSGEDGDDTGTGAGGAPATTTAAPAIPTTSTIGVVTGRLAPAARTQVRDAVTVVVDGWLDAAYVGGEYPRADFADAFPGFTRDAAAQARRDGALMSNRSVGQRVDEVTATARRVRIDVLAVKGRAAAVTARVQLGLRLAGEIDRIDRVSGRLLLTRGGRGWRVFGYDVDRGRA